MDIFSLGIAGLIAFGGTWFVDLLLKRFAKKSMSSEVKFAVSIAIALGAGYIPADLGNDLANRVKVAVGIATGAAGFYQLLSRVATKVSGTEVVTTPVGETTSSTSAGQA